MCETVKQSVEPKRSFTDVSQIRSKKLTNERVSQMSFTDNYHSNEGVYMETICGTQKEFHRCFTDTVKKIDQSESFTDDIHR